MSWKVKLIDLAKRVPLDLGQGNLRFVTEGKLIAQALVPAATADRSTALDVGCREGAQTRWLEQRGYTVTSIDVEKVYPRAEIVDADKELPYPDASFDTVWCSEVIEHLDDPAFSLSELRRVLKPGGTLVLTTPNSYAWFYRLASATGLPPAKLQHAGHKQFFDEADIQRLFPRARIYGYFPYALVKRRIRRGLGWLTPTFVVVETKPVSG
jgi:SAM-dependent methyltransferase